MFTRVSVELTLNKLKCRSAFMHSFYLNLNDVRKTIIKVSRRRDVLAVDPG